MLSALYMARVTLVVFFGRPNPEAEHAELLSTLGGIQGKFILSGYPSQPYRKAEQENGWRCIEIEIDNKASKASAKQTKTECLWMNFGRT